MDSSNERSVLSPVFNRTDKSFIFNLNNFIDEELALIESAHTDNNNLLKEKYIIFKQAFNKVIFKFFLK